MKRFIILSTCFLISSLQLSCKNSEINSTEVEKDTPNKLFAYPSAGNIVYLVDYESYEVVKEIKLEMPNSLGLFAITISTNRDYLVFSGMELQPPFGHFIACYHISDGALQTFMTDFDSVGAPRIAPAQDHSNPGHIYLYSHSLGLYSIDFIEQRVVQCISEEHGQSLGKFFYNTPNASYTSVLKKYTNPSYSEIEFYQQGSSLQNLLFVFNENDEYDMSVYDVDFSDNDEFMYVSYQLSEKRSREIESYFGIFDMNKNQLLRSELRLPWSLNPYYIEYSPKRKEAYLVGAYDQFYIVNTDSNALIDSVTISGKVEGPSRILTDPNENVAFVSCSRSDKIVVIDLESRQVIENIHMERPYKMIIP